MDKPQEQIEQPVAQNEAPAAVVEEPKVEEPVEVKPAEPAPSKPVEEGRRDEDRIEEVKGDAPAAQVKAQEPAPADNRPEYMAKHAGLSQFFDRLPAILEATGHKEMWGVPLKDQDDIPTVNVMIKFLRANEGNVKAAEEQLTKALQWRKERDPLGLVADAKFSSQKYKDLGFITTYGADEAKSVFTWNIYGAVKDLDKTFGDLNEFINWRVALMELAIREMNLDKATAVIPSIGEDPYQMFQIHDYQNVSFFRMSPIVRNASRETISVFTMAYPELLREKFFVNVPVVMSWFFSTVKVFLSKKTIRKFHPLTNGAELAAQFGEAGVDFPKPYGGKSPELAESGRTVTLVDDSPIAQETEAEPKPQNSVKPEIKQVSQSKPEDTKTETVVEPVKTATEAPVDKPATEASETPKPVEASTLAN